jgi:hypothetical protein
LRTFRASNVIGGDAVLRQAMQMVEQAANRSDSFIELQILRAEPQRLRAGMVVYADGTDWNPGSGEGIYRRNVANNAWVFLG